MRLYSWNMKDCNVAIDDEFGILLLLESHFVCILTGSRNASHLNPGQATTGKHGSYLKTPFVLIV